MKFKSLFSPLFDKRRSKIRIKLTAILSTLFLSSFAFGQENDRTTFRGAYKGPGEAPPTARADEADVRPNAKAYNVNAVVVTGDREAVYALENWESYENNALYDLMSDADVESFRQAVLKDLQAQGYLFATVSVYTPSLRQGFLKLRVHVGDKGEVTVSGNKWYTAEQILDDVNWQTGAGFNYRDLYDDLYGLNVSPSMKVKTQLKPRVDADGKRVVDIDFDVEDRFPVHVAWNMSNTGTKETGSWRSRLTGQFLNISQNDDTFTIDWLSDPHNWHEINAVSASYYRPLNDTWSATLYGGISATEVDDVVPLLDTFGEGWYLGLNLERKLKETKQYTMDLSVGWLFQETENVNEFAGVVLSEGQRTVKLSMPKITFGYADREYDRFGGRNFFTNTIMANFSGLLGSKDNFASSLQNPGADETFLINRFQFARFQQLFGSDDKPGKWTMFFKVDGQLATTSLPSALYHSIGGANSVRGYQESEALGDYGFNTTLEIRAPIFQNFLPGLIRSEEYLKENPYDWAMHRLQFIMFYDIGWAGFHDPLPGQQDDMMLQGTGLGLRFGVTKYSQFRFDFGIPVQDTNGYSESGRTHFSVQLQY